MKKKILFIFCMLVFSALIAMTATNVGAKSLYVNIDLNANSPISAYDIQGPPNYLVWQQTSSPTHYGGVGLAIDTDSEMLFVTFEGYNTLDIVFATNLSIGEQVTAPGASDLAGIVVDQDRQKVYCVDRNTNHLYQYSWDPGNLTLTNDITSSPYYVTLPGVSSGLHGIALDETNDLLYVGDITTTVKYFNTADWSAAGSFTVTQAAMGIAVDVANGYVYTGNAYGGYGSQNLLSKYDLNTGNETTINIGSSDNVVGLAVDPATSLVYITTGDQGSGGTDEVRVYDSDLTLLHQTGDIGNPTGLAIPGKDISYNPLNLIKSDGLEEGDCVNPGDSITYTICFDNTNEFDVNNLFLVDNLPEEVSFSDASDGGTYDGVNHTVDWELGALPSGDDDCIWLEVDVDPSTPAGITITNHVTIDSDETPPTTQSEITLICNVTVDKTPPLQTLEFGNPKTYREWYGVNYTVVSCSTPLWINSTDPGGVGSEMITYSVWYTDDPTPNENGSIVTEQLYEKTVYDGDPEDMDPANGSVSVELYMEETCFHEIIYQCWDYNGNTDGHRDIDFIADCCGPNTTKDVGSPQYGEEYPNWVSCETPLWFDSVDECCLPNGTAVDYLEIKVWWKSNISDLEEPWKLNDTIIIFDEDGEDTNDMKGRISYELHFDDDCGHEIWWRGVDILGNEEAWKKQKHKVDCTPPEIMKTVGDPNCELIAGEEYCVTTNTPITFCAEDRGCMGGVGLAAFGYRIWSQESWGDYYWLEEDCETIYFEQECMHILEIYAIDYLGNEISDIETFYVDDTYPVIEKEVGEPNCEEPGNDVDYLVTTLTPIYVNVTDDGCCDSLTVEISEDGENWTIVPDHYIHYFGEECLHWLYVRAYDCLGHVTWHNESFYVDDYAPEITKTVGEPNCPDPQGADFCVTTQTPIQINITSGCDPTFWIYITDDGGESWIFFGSEVTDGFFSYTHYFSEECFHNLSIWAVDCLDRWDIDIEYFFVDDTAPVITKEVGSPKCEEPQGADYVVTTSTPIYVNTTDPGCCPSLTVEISEDGENWTIVSEEYVHYFTEECIHWLYIRAYDCLGHITWHNESFFVDDYAPEITKIVGDPNCIPEEGADYCVTTHTPIDINVSYGCSPWFMVEISVNGDDWEEIEVPYTFYFEEECYHTLDIRAWDCFGRMTYHNESFFVDDTPPAFEKTVGMPNCGIIGQDKHGHDIWGCLTTDTEINLTAVDEGCCNSPAYIFYRISVLGYWSEWMEYTGNFTFKEGCTHWLEVNITDCLGNYILDNETFIVHGDNGPHIEIVAPEDDEVFDSREDKYVYAMIKGYYGDDPDDHNITVTCWLDNPYGAPDQYYPVEWNEEEDCFVAEIDIYKYSTGSTLQLVAKGEDNYGGRDYDDVSFEVETTVDYDKWMEEGWNGPINIALIGCDDSVESVFASILDDAYAVFEVGSWNNYKFHAPFKGGTLQTIDPSKWYWVSMMNASRFFIDSNPPMVEITTPPEGIEIAGLDEFAGIAYDIETGIAEVTVQIYDENTSEYWDGSTWQGSTTELPCSGTEDWEYADITFVNWSGRDDHTIWLTAIAYDMSGCWDYDQIYIINVAEEED